MRPWWGGNTALPGITWVWVSGCWQTCRDNVNVPKRLATVTVSRPSAWTTAGGKTLAVLLRQMGINPLPLSLKQVPQDGSTGSVGGGFQIIESGLRLEGRDISFWKIENSEFSHLLARGIVHTADQHANVAHAVLLDL